ncbi:MAG: transposase [Deltaproteobacteria bacterium]|nr:transposase [Deltaproteobacteria bacterium]
MGSALEHGLNPGLIVMSDDAGQFNVLIHALCWIHAERTLTKLIGFSDKQRADLDHARTQVWDLYQILKAYKPSPSETKKLEIQERFDAIFTQYTSFASLNLALERLYKNKSELLLVLQYPDIPLHNNLSECDIREYVKKRKISGSTRSANGRRCRDTFTSLIKTCRKLGISFWDYLKDSVSGAGNIAPIGELILRHA